MYYKTFRLSFTDHDELDEKLNELSKEGCTAWAYIQEVEPKKYIKGTATIKFKVNDNARIR